VRPRRSHRLGRSHLICFFGIPLIWGVCITALDVLVILLLQNKGFATTGGTGHRARRHNRRLLRVLENYFFSTGSQLNRQGFLPSPQIVVNPEMLYIAIGILGATVMPTQSLPAFVDRADTQLRAQSACKREAIKFATIDSTFALMFALFINAAISSSPRRRFIAVATAKSPRFGDAYKLLTPLPWRHWRQHSLRDCAAGLRPKLYGSLAL